MPQKQISVTIDIPEWKKYTGSDEQIEEMRNATHGFLTSVNGPVRYLNPAVKPHMVERLFLLSGIESYLICEPNPNADMICQQARTGQPVWIKEHHTNYYDGIIESSEELSYKTDTPNWYLDAEYSFTEFKD